MKMMKSACFMIAVITAPSLYAQTDSANQNQAYGDNPNIFRVLAHKTSEAVQNTAEKVGTATEKGIQKIKPSFDATIENTKNYTTEQATIARDNTRQGIDTAVKKVEQTKDRITGKNSYNIPIESGSLSQSSTTVNPSQNNTVPYTAPIVQEAPISTQPIQQIPLPQNNVQNAQEEPEIKKQSLSIENNATPNASHDRDTTTNNSSTGTAKTSPDNAQGDPR